MQTDLADPVRVPGDRCVAFVVAPGLTPLALPPSTLVEALMDPVDCPLPGAPPALRRIVALRGALLPLFDLAAWLGLAIVPGPRVLAIGRGDRAAALLAQDEPRVVEVHDDPAAPPPPAALAPFVRGGRDADGAALWRFDHEAWFAVAADPSHSPAGAALRAAEATP
jgi:chemotaxis signal transduction protein